MIDIKDILTLSDGKKYSVVSKTIKNKIVYYFLVDINDNSNIKICYENKKPNQIDLVEVTDKNQIRDLLVAFAKNM